MSMEQNTPIEPEQRNTLPFRKKTLLIIGVVALLLTSLITVAIVLKSGPAEQQQAVKQAALQHAQTSTPGGVAQSTDNVVLTVTNEVPRGAQ